MFWILFIPIRFRRNIQVQTLRFYLSHINLIQTDNTPVKITDIGFFDFSSTANLSFIVDKLQGNYKGIAFACGVDSLMDTIPPFAANAPQGLDEGADFMWGPQMAYTFENFNGVWDSGITLPIDSARNFFYYHIVGQPYYRQVQFNSNFSVRCDNIVTKTITLDIEKIFYNVRHANT